MMTTKLRDLTTYDEFPEPIEFLTLDQWEQKIQLAEWYMRRAGMEPKREKHYVTIRRTK